MRIEWIKPEELTPYKNNPRKNDKAVDAVAASIREFGFKVPITIDTDGVVVTGHTRLKAAIKLGLQEVPVIRLDDLAPAQVKAFRLADNKVGEMAQWDFDLLEAELAGLDIDIDMQQFGFELPENFERLEEDDFKVELGKTPKSVIGDIYKLGEHRLMCGDATDPEVVAELMDGAAADLLIIDPPYNVDYEGEAGKIIGDRQPDAQFQEFLTQLYIAADGVLRRGGHSTFGTRTVRVSTSARRAVG